MLLDAKGVECSTGSACTAGVAQPSHVLIAMGADPATARGSLRFSLGHTSTEADVDAVLEVLPAAVERARQAALASAGRTFIDEGSGRDERRRGLLGGRRPDGRCRPRRRRRAHGAVVGAGRRCAPDPGGAAPRRMPGDARRVADILDIPFYVWDFADRFKDDVIDDFVESYARGETPNPCVRCNERIKFSALSARALALGFDAVATGHYARLADGRLRRAVDADKDQSYVLGVLTAEQLRARAVPDRRHPQAADPRRGRRAWPGRRRKARQPRHLLHPVRRHPARSWAPGSGSVAARCRQRTVRCSPNTTACTASPSDSARVWASRGRAPTAGRATSPAIDAESGTVRVGAGRGPRRCGP